MDENNQEKKNIPEVEKGLSPVATIPAKNLVTGAIVVVGAIFFAIQVFWGDSKEKKANTNMQYQAEAEVNLNPNIKPSRPSEIMEQIPEIPKLPEAPSVTAPVIDTTSINKNDMNNSGGINSDTNNLVKIEDNGPIAVDLYGNMQPETINFDQNGPLDEKDNLVSLDEEKTPQLELSAKLRSLLTPEELANLASDYASNMNDVGSDGFFAGRKNKERKESKMQFNGTSGDSSLDSGDGIHTFKPARTSFDKVNVTRVGDMSSLIAQGKIIDAVIETAINTDFTGKIRAMITRDIYSESGKIILIPKGSRVIGEYDTGVTYGQDRVTLVWNRIIRPDGIDIAVDSPGVDALGRAGAEALVDNKYFQVLANALMVSSVNVLWTKMIDDKFGTEGGSNVTIEKYTTADGTPSIYSESTNVMDDAVRQAADDVKGTLDAITQNTKNAMKPTLTVDQGSKIKIFVNRDIIFPYSLTGKNQILQ